MSRHVYTMGTGVNGNARTDRCRKVFVMDYDPKALPFWEVRRGGGPISDWVNFTPKKPRTRMSEVKQAMTRKAKESIRVSEKIHTRAKSKEAEILLDDNNHRRAPASDCVGTGNNWASQLNDSGMPIGAHLDMSVDPWSRL